MASHDMAGYAAQLRATTPASSMGRPVTEICIFKLKPDYAADPTAALAEFDRNCVQITKPGAQHAKGIRRIAWGIAIDDLTSLVWCLDWDKIEDHWDFWQTEGFPPVIGVITKLFEPGRPLVRHYDFGDAGMVGGETSKVVRIIVWDDGEGGKERGEALAQGNAQIQDVTEARESYAVDVGEQTWWCSMLGFENEEDAAAAKGNQGDEVASSHIYRLSYA